MVYLGHVSQESKDWTAYKANQVDKGRLENPVLRVIKEHLASLDQQEAMGKQELMVHLENLEDWVQKEQ